MKKLYLSLLCIIVLMSFTPINKIFSKNIQDETQLSMAFNETGAIFNYAIIHIEFNEEIKKEEILKVLSLDNCNATLYSNEKTGEVLYIEITYNELSQMTIHTQAIRDLLMDKSIKNNIMTTIYGELNKELDKDEMISLSKEVLKSIGARQIEGGFLESAILSISGYTKNISEYIPVGGNKINLCVVLKNNENSTNTKLILATPVIYENY